MPDLNLDEYTLATLAEIYGPPALSWYQVVRWASIDGLISADEFRRLNKLLDDAKGDKR